MRSRRAFFTALALTTVLTAAASAAPVLITGIESDTKGSFPPAADGDWGAFGGSLADFAINTNVANVDVGAQSLEISAAWASWGMGISYNIPGASIDISGANSVISYRAKQDAANTETVKVRIVESDGDVWVAGGDTFTTTFEAYYADMSTATIDAVNGDGSLDLSAIAEVGFVLYTNGTATGTTLIDIDEIYYGASIPTSTPPVLPVVTTMDSPDTTTGGFPPDPPTGGTEGEWTRFGAAYNGIFLLSNSANASDGDNYLQVSANWPAGTRVGIRHKPYGAPADWSPYSFLEFDLHANTLDVNTTCQFALFETDGDIWTGPNMSVSDSYETKTINFATDLTLDVASTGDSTLDLAAVELYGLNFDNSTFTGLQDFLVDNIRLTNTPTAVADWMVFE